MPNQPTKAKYLECFKELSQGSHLRAFPVSHHNNTITPCDMDDNNQYQQPFCLAHHHNTNSPCDMDGNNSVRTTKLPAPHICNQGRPFGLGITFVPCSSGI